MTDPFEEFRRKHRKELERSGLSDNHYRRSANHPEFREYCARLNEAYCTALEAAVQRVVDKLGLEEAKRRLKLLKVDHPLKLPSSSTDVILETRLVLDMTAHKGTMHDGELLGIVIATVQEGDREAKFQMRVDWSPKAVELGFVTGELHKGRGS